jgi:hypothetical protein
MVERVRVDHSVSPASSAKAPFAPADRGRHEIENLHDGRAQGGNGVPGASCDVISHPASLAVSHIGKGYEGRGVRHGVGLFDRVTDRVDVRVARLVRLVDCYGAAWAQLERRELGETDVGTDADRPDDEVCWENPAVGESNRGVSD